MNSRNPAKQLAITIWNAGHQLVWAFSERLEAIFTGRIERCACCGRIGLMLRRSRSIPAKLIALWGLSRREAAALVRKETLACSRCGAKLRCRRLASVIIDALATGGPKPKSLREWSTKPAISTLKVAEINLIDGVHEALALLTSLQSSDYREPGEAVDPNPTPSEDLTQLSYADESFDLVMTSETLEHVPDLAKALSEIHRVLKPGGLHIFTIPVRASVPHTFARRELRADGTVADLATPIFHPGGDWGYPVFREFGIDVVDVIDRAGFSTTVHFGPTSEDDVAQVYVSRRC